MLGEKRYAHTLGVAAEAAKLAKKYGADPAKAEVAGIIHDCAKEMPRDEGLAAVKANNLTLDEITLAEPKLLHAPLGAFIAKSRMGVTDEEILHAVRVHTTACADMSPLDKVLYMADYIEPNRVFPGVDGLCVLAYEDLDAAILVGLDFTINELVEGGKPIHPDTTDCRNQLILRRDAHCASERNT